MAVRHSERRALRRAYNIFACSRSGAAFTLLQALLKTCNIGIDVQETLPHALKTFREDETITLDSIMEDEDKKDYIFFLYRVSEVKKHFIRPGQDLSSTDTDQSQRARHAARALENPKILQGYAGLPEILQEKVAYFTSRYNAENSGAAAEDPRKEWGTKNPESDEPTIHPRSTHSDGAAESDAHSEGGCQTKMNGPEVKRLKTNNDDEQKVDD